MARSSTSPRAVLLRPSMPSIFRRIAWPIHRLWPPTPQGVDIGRRWTGARRHGRHRSDFRRSAKDTPGLRPGGPDPDRRCRARPDHHAGASSGAGHRPADYDIFRQTDAHSGRHLHRGSGDTDRRQHLHFRVRSGVGRDLAQPHHRRAEFGDLDGAGWLALHGGLHHVRHGDARRDRSAEQRQRAVHVLQCSQYHAECGRQRLHARWEHAL